MLSPSQRLRRSADFTAVLSRGRRARTEHVAVHVLSPAGNAAAHTRVGLVVSAKVGNSVVRHRVSRRLREQIRPLITEVSSGTDIVVRAFPTAATATSAELRSSLQSALRRTRPSRQS